MDQGSGPSGGNHPGRPYRGRNRRHYGQKSFPGRGRQGRSDRRDHGNNDPIVDTLPRQLVEANSIPENYVATITDTMSFRPTNQNSVNEPIRHHNDRCQTNPGPENTAPVSHRHRNRRFVGHNQSYNRARHVNDHHNQHTEAAESSHEDPGASHVANQMDRSETKPSHQRRFIRDRNINPNDPTTNQAETTDNNPGTKNMECMICCDNIYRSNPIWYCDNCYNVFHLKCSLEWFNKSIRSRNEAIAAAQNPPLQSSSASLNSGPLGNLDANRYGSYRNDTSTEWACPACREVLTTKPSKYKCYCGKVIRPEINRHLAPHSCGQMCGRKRPNSDCDHTCNSICHPGRCDPCPLTSRKSCFCGKLTQEIRCSVSVGSCGEVCAKLLNCGIHKCTRSCHDGPCGQCDEQVIINCYCGRRQVEKICGQLDKSLRNVTKGCFSCGEICDIPLDCGKHPCVDKCHPPSKCPSCPLLSKNLKTCPCGSTSIKKDILAKRESCTDPIPTCENKCNRRLICGPHKNHHKCQKKCHTGPCPPCKLKTTVKCSCSLSTKTIDCSLMYEKIEDGPSVHFKQAEYSFNCETRCNKPKNCGRHRCQNKCCKAYREQISELHKCDQLCNKKLACGQHNCSEPCHPGQCGDCTNIGWEELSCHCGASIMYPPIPCNSRPPACHRPCRRPHGCGHPVTHECHDETEKCAPCIVFVKKSCFCGAESKDSVYCYLSGYSCGRTCKRSLSCRQHTCKRVCHDNECETPNQRGVILCQQACPVPRFNCKHPCGLPCHGKTPCPISDCKKVTEIFCECGNKSERIECHKLMKDVGNRNKVAMLSMNRSNQDSIMIDLSKKTAPDTSLASNCSNNSKKLDCDDSCAILKRNKALAEALQIEQPDLKPNNAFGEDPLRLIKEATAHDYKFVASTYNSLVRVIKTAKESEKRFTFLKFNPADKLRREVVHELAHHFNCTSDSDGEEPFRHVVVRVYKNKSSVPEFTIEQLLPVTD